MCICYACSAVLCYIMLCCAVSQCVCYACKHILASAFGLALHIMLCSLIVNSSIAYILNEAYLYEGCSKWSEWTLRMCVYMYTRACVSARARACMCIRMQ